MCKTILFLNLVLSGPNVESCGPSNNSNNHYTTRLTIQTRGRQQPHIQSFFLRKQQREREIREGRQTMQLAILQCSQRFKLDLPYYLWCY